MKELKDLISISSTLPFQLAVHLLRKWGVNNLWTTGQTCTDVGEAPQGPATWGTLQVTRMLWRRHLSISVQYWTPISFTYELFTTHEKKLMWNKSWYNRGKKTVGWLTVGSVTSSCKVGKRPLLSSLLRMSPKISTPICCLLFTNCVLCCALHISKGETANSKLGLDPKFPQKDWQKN